MASRSIPAVVMTTLLLIAMEPQTANPIRWLWVQHTCVS